MTGPHAGQPVERLGPPLEEALGVMIMVHGRGADAADILEVARVLRQPKFAYIAPSASGNTWYPHSFMAEKERNEPWLSSALEFLGEQVDEVLQRGVQAERLILLGFSQGACLTGEFAVRHARRFGGVVLYSGGLIGPPGTAWDDDGSFADTPIFLGCSDVDPHIPRSRVDESAEVFERMGGQVTKRIYPGMGHTVNADEIEFTQQLMATVAR